MLYVFHVDAGVMSTYDMSLTLESVSSLKTAIERKTKIPASLLVLLVSGGEVLQSDHMVSSYSAGTDTNPIYMFSKPSVRDGSLKQSTQYSEYNLSPIVELSNEQWRSDTRSFEGRSLAEMQAEVDRCCALPPSVQTVATCAALAQQFSELGCEVARSCEQLVHDQHLQHQGWSAVIANLDDIYNEFCERSKNFKEAFRKHRQKKEHYYEQLVTLGEVLQSLGSIPILNALKTNAEAHRFSGFDVFETATAEFEEQYEKYVQSDSSDNQMPQDFGVDAFKLSEEDVFEPQNQVSQPEAGTSEVPLEESDEGVTFKAPSVEVKEEPTLLHWIFAPGNNATLQDILDYCKKGLGLIDDDPLKEREQELCQMLALANTYGLKQIRGIEDRLYRLDQLLNDVRKLVRDQRDQAASLIQNRERVSTSCDPSVLPTLVQSHRCQLEQLMRNHQQVVDIRRRVAKSKDELSHILKARLEAVLSIENAMSAQDAHQMLSFQCLHRLARYFDVVAQLHAAPSLFVRAVIEVRRRRRFSHAFLQWASDLAMNLLQIHNEEVARRQEFISYFDGHFLKSLFPGMGDIPPPFATQAPPAFDTRIPLITETDVTEIVDSFPDLVKDVPRYDMEATVKFFQQKFTAVPCEDKYVDVREEDIVKAFESETGDFERLSGQSESEKQKVDTSTICVPDTMAVSTVTEDNMDTHRINMDKLKDFLIKLHELCKMNMILIKDELLRLKSEMEDQKRFFTGKYIEISEGVEKCREEYSLQLREATQRLTVDHELELSDLKNVLASKDEVIDSLKKEMEDLKAVHQREIDNLVKEHNDTKSEVDKSREEIKAFEAKLDDNEAAKQKEIKELQEKLNLQYKAEMESLRSRFRLVALTNMDRSPSESSLEKIERTDMIEIASHNAIVMQTKENAEVEKEEAVREATEKCNAEWQAKLTEEVNAVKQKFEGEKQNHNEVTRRLLSEKDRQLELLREREANLVRESTKYKETIQQLTDPETNEIDAVIRTQLATLENEKSLLQQQMENLKKELEKKVEESEKSKEEDSDARSSSPGKECRGGGGGGGGAGRHTPVGVAGGALSLAACLPGHAVLLLWCPAHTNYTVLQESSTLYFVHSDCLAALDLSINVRNENERKLYAVATVESKEFCYAKKSGNRYHMPRGSRFYRVRVKPYKQYLTNPPCCDHKHKHDALPGPALAALCDRPVKKWLTYMHAPDHSSKSADNSHSTSSNTEDVSRVSEVATATLINLESPIVAESGAIPPDVSEVDNVERATFSDVAGSGADATGSGADTAGSGTEVEPNDSLDTGEWHTARMQQSTTSAMTDMECSVGRVLGADMELPTELIVSSMSVQARASSMPPDSELAEEATP